MDHDSALSRFTESYRRPAPPPWVVGRPQPAVVALAENGLIRGRVLDAGTGTGEHTVLLTRLGHDVLGVDFVEAAVEEARRRAAAEGADAWFEVADVLADPGVRAFGTFDTVLDSALFHNFDTDERRRYLEVLPQILRPGGVVFVLALATGGGLGPEVDEEELTHPFVAAGWSVEDVSAASYAGTVRHERHVSRFGLPVGSPVTVPAWLARFTGPHPVR